MRKQGSLKGVGTHRGNLFAYVNLNKICQRLGTVMRKQGSLKGVGTHRGVLSRFYQCFCWYFNLVGMILIMLYCFFFLFPLLPLWGDDQRLVLGPLSGAKAWLDLNLGPPYMPSP